MRKELPGLFGFPAKQFPARLIQKATGSTSIFLSARRTIGGESNAIDDSQQLVFRTVTKASMKTYQGESIDIVTSYGVPSNRRVTGSDGYAFTVR